jgi:glycerol uptake facilitator-like aquaporin
MIIIKKRFKMKMKIFIISACSILSLQANDGFNSEASHFVGGTVLAGGITAVVDQYYPEYKSDRGMIGFGISSIAIIAEQSIEYAVNGNAKSQLMDAASHILGSALGAYITDKYILLPVVKDSSTDGKYVGLNVQHRF